MLQAGSGIMTPRQIDEVAADIAQRVIANHGRTEDWLNEEWIARIVREAAAASLREFFRREREDD
jgi:hypothetical protein